MLYDLLTINRTELLERCNVKAARRLGPAKLENGVAPLLDGFAKSLRATRQQERLGRELHPWKRGEAPVDAGLDEAAVDAGLGEAAADAGLGEAAARHGLELSRRGFPIEEVAYSCGDLCQAITDLALEHDAPIRTEEFRALNLCLDNAIADALKAYSRRRESLRATDATRELNERLGLLVHELRNHLGTATLALLAMEGGHAGSAGATATVMARSMTRMRNLLDRTLGDVRATADLAPRFGVIALAEFIAEIEASASLEARARSCSLSVAAVDPTLAIRADRDMLLSAVTNLLQNGFKFTRRGTTVHLRAYARGDRVLIEIEDACGGLPNGDVEGILEPFMQNGADRSGTGLGLSICRHNVAANGGALLIRDLPGSGCVFTVDLPQCERLEPAVETLSRQTA